VACGRRSCRLLRRPYPPMGRQGASGDLPGVPRPASRRPARHPARRSTGAAIPVSHPLRTSSYNSRATRHRQPMPSSGGAPSIRPRSAPCRRRRSSTIFSRAAPAASPTSTIRGRRVAMMSRSSGDAFWALTDLISAQAGRGAARVAAMLQERNIVLRNVNMGLGHVCFYSYGGWGRPAVAGRVAICQHRWRRLRWWRRVSGAGGRAVSSCSG